ncbi:MAG: dihydroorotate dehydrogenase-like protein [Myxococcota bacterium]
MTVDLTTRYLGLTLAHPLMPGASPLVDDLGTVRRLEDAGAAAIVMHSLFEEQLGSEQMAAHHLLDGPGEAHAEAVNYFPSTPEFTLGPNAYLEQLRRIREAVAVPVIASLNGTSLGGWVEYAGLMEQAGAHAVELNLYQLPSDPAVDAGAVEAQQLEVVRAVCKAASIPIAVKLSPFYSALPAFVRALGEAGAAGVVVFNRLYEPDIDPEALDLDRRLELSQPSELLMRLRWLAILSARADEGLSLGATGGVHGPRDALKAVMAGAHGVQMVSALLRHGPGHLRTAIEGLRSWLDEHGYTSIEEARGSMNDARAPDPSAYERVNYLHLLSSWHGTSTHHRSGS